MLRGSHECDYQPMQQREEQKKKSVGHSNVLAPEHRSVDGARRILWELFSKALRRLREYDQAASAVSVTVKYQHIRGTVGSPEERYWTKRSRRHLHANDEATWLKIVRPLMEAVPDLSPSATPSYVGIVFSDFLAVEDITLSLFDEEEDRRRLATIVDAVNRKHGERLFLGAFHGAGDVLPLRIPFGAPDSPDIQT